MKNLNLNREELEKLTVALDKAICHNEEYIQGNKSYMDGEHKEMKERQIRDYKDLRIKIHTEVRRLMDQEVAGVIESRLQAACFALASDPTNEQIRRSLEHEYRYAIAEGNLEGGKAKYMSDIEVFVLASGSARVSYKGLLIGFYNATSVKELMNIRTNLRAWNNQEWFQYELNSAK